VATIDRFEGAYGAAYDAVLKRPALRRIVFRGAGPSPILDLERHLGEFVADVPDDATLLDLPCGGGALLPLLERAGFHGSVVEVDLASAMIERARAAAGQVTGFGVQVVQGDATSLPLEDSSIDAVVSINGLHVLDEPDAALREMVRVLRTGGRALVVTIATTGSVRNRALRLVARAGSILPRTPETRASMLQLMTDAGFELEADLGGATFAGYRLRRAATT
jgi:ubiquinone/menaquinone biosynthesis C-methylase UbiE